MRLNHRDQIGRALPSSLPLRRASVFTVEPPPCRVAGMPCFDTRGAYATLVAVSVNSAQITSVKHRFVQVNGIKMHIAEQGEGPLVVLAHGFPELWYSWRHVLPALATAGYHAVAPDMRGYGQTDATPAIKDYARPQCVADMVWLVRALGYEQAVIAGHDQGAPL